MFSSPFSVWAPSPAAVASLASAVGGFVRCSLRRSVRSFSGWVAVCVFRSPSVAGGFAAAVASGFGLPFCAVRRLGFGWGVSVPVLCRWLRLPAAGRRLLRRPFRGVRAVFRRFVPAVPLAVAFGCASAVGFSGSRSSVPSACASVVPLVLSGCPVFVGCAPGVDGFFRAAFPSASVFAAASFGSGRGSFAARSVAVVRAVAAAGASAGSGGLWVSFPSGACPAGLAPSASSSRCFSGSGSGSWASLAFAAGSGLSCLVFGFAPPASWGFSPLGGGWWWLGSPVRQLSLF